MNGLRHSLMVLAVVSAGVLSVMAVANLTVLRPTYVAETAEAVRFYDEVAASLPQLLSPGTGSMALLGQSLIQETATSTYVRLKFEAFLQDFERYMMGAGPPPTLDFRDITDKAAEAGLALPPGTLATTQIVIEEPGLQQFLQNSRLAQWITAGLLVFFLAAACALSPRGKRLVPVAVVAVGAAVLNGVLYFTSHLLPSPIIGLLGNNRQLEMFTPGLKRLGEALGQGAASQHLYLAAILGGIGVILGVIQVGLNIRRKFHHD